MTEGNWKMNLPLYWVGKLVAWEQKGFRFEMSKDGFYYTVSVSRDGETRQGDKAMFLSQAVSNATALCRQMDDGEDGAEE